MTLLTTDALSIERKSELDHIEKRIGQFQKFQSIFLPHFTSMAGHSQPPEERERSLRAIHNLVIEKFKVWKEGRDGKGAVLPITLEELKGFEGSQEEVELTSTKIKERLQMAVFQLETSKGLFAKDLGTFLTNSNTIVNTEGERATLSHETLVDLQKPFSHTKELLQGRVNKASQLRVELKDQMVRIDTLTKHIELNQRWFTHTLNQAVPEITMEAIRTNIKVDFQEVQKLILKLIQEKTVLEQIVLGLSDKRDEEEAEETELGIFIWNLGFRHPHFKEQLDLDFDKDEIDPSVFYHWGVRLDEVKGFTQLEEFITFIRENFNKKDP